MAVAAFVIVAAGVSATQIPESQQMIGVCHATGNGYVFLVVPKDGYEHGHHRHNPDNYFVSPTAGCDGDDPWQDSEPVQDVEEPEETEQSDIEDVDDSVDNATDAPADDADVDDAEDTTDNADDNVTVEEEAEEETVNQTISDAAARLAIEQDSESAYVTVKALSLGDAEVGDVSLSMELPNVGRAWTLAGADAADCVLGDRLDCWFGALAAGETREIFLVAHLDQLPCGDGINLTATIAALDDAEARNDASSAGIVPRAC